MEEPKIAPSNNEEDFEPGFQKPKKNLFKRNAKSPAPFNFWRGLQTALGAAFIVATLFTLWMPGSLIESNLDAKLSDVLESGLDPDGSGSEQNDGVQSNRIGIVAGHYGENDPGAVCSDGLTEVEMNLEIATLVQKALTDLGYDVDLLEEFDTRLDGYQALVVLSIHLDSCQYINDEATGFKVAGALSNQDVASGQRLTACLSQRYGEITGLPYHAGSVTDDMTYYHAFNEIDPGTSAAIIEAGFLNRDYQFITEQTEKIAEGIVAGIQCFLNEETIYPTSTP